MRFLSLLGFVILLSINSNAQVLKSQKKGHGEHAINISFTPQWNINRLDDIENSGVDFGQQVLYPKNTIGYNLGLEYQHITRYGLVVSLGVQFGAQRHDIGVKYNLGYVNETLPELKTVMIDTQYGATVKNMALRVMAGYRWKSPFGMPSGWDILTKGGLSLRHYRNYSFNSYSWMVQYEKNDTLFLTEAADDSHSFGSSQPFGSGFNYAFDFYGGLSRELNCGFLRTISIGIEGTYMIHGGSGYVRETLQKRDVNTGMVITYGSYIYSPKDFALGVRFTVGLGWPNVKYKK